MKKRQPKKHQNRRNSPQASQQEIQQQSQPQTQMPSHRQSTDDGEDACQDPARNALVQPTLLETPLVIDSMAFGGRGVGRHDGKVYFVEDAMEGDVVKINVTKTSTRYNEGSVREIITPSPHRGISPCQYADACGGCQWQGVNYQQQLIWKKRFLANAVKRIGKIGDDIDIEISGSPDSNAYRNRIFVRARITPAGSLTLGYFKRGSRDFISIQECKIASSRLNEFITQALSLNFKKEMETFGIAGEIKFRFEMQELPDISDGAPHILVSVYDTDHKQFPTHVIVSKFSTLSSVRYAVSQTEFANAEIVPFEKHLNFSFFTAASVFQQINVKHNHVLRKLVLDEVAKLSEPRGSGLHILDLFCGSGNLSLPLADGQNNIEGIEFSSKAIEIAKYNVAHGKVSNARYYAGDTTKHLWNLANQQRRFDVVIADPPREGMQKSLIPLMKIKPEVIIYISCDPTTLSRDLSVLCQRDYKIKSLKALDFFPNTYHIESFAILTRNQR